MLKDHNILTLNQCNVILFALYAAMGTRRSSDAAFPVFVLPPYCTRLENKQCGGSSAERVAPYVRE